MKSGYETKQRLKLLLAVTMVLMSSCADDGDGELDQCACTQSECPEMVCNVALMLPASCSAAAQVTLDGASAGQAQPGSAYNSCATIPVGETQSIAVEASGLLSEPTTASCSPGGVTAQAEYCSLRFDLAETCRGQVDSATVVVDGTEVGTTSVDEPLIPCVLVPTGQEVQGTIRAGLNLVLTAPMPCTSSGSERRLTMECP